MTTPNAELAYATLDYIDAHPEEWDQVSWYCGTSACFAGRALLLSGCQLVRIGFNEAEVTSGPEPLVGMYVEYAAYDALGITDNQGASGEEWLFDPDNGRDDLGRLVAEIFGPRPAPKPSLDRDPVEAAIYDGVSPSAGREEMQPPPCADHKASELSCPVCTAQRRAFYTALGRES